MATCCQPQLGGERSLLDLKWVFSSWQEGEGEKNYLAGHLGGFLDHEDDRESSGCHLPDQIST